MNDNICEQCGTRNEPGAQFCVECQAFLPWYDTQETDLQHRGAAGAAGAVPVAATGPATITEAEAPEDVSVPAVAEGAASPPAPVTSDARAAAELRRAAAVAAEPAANERIRVLV